MFKNSQSLLKSLVAVGLLAIALVACQSVQAAPQAEGTSGATPARTITVVGIGDISLKPNVGEIHVGAEASAATVSEAKGEVDRQIAAILAALKEMGIEDKDIQTANYSIYFERESYQPVVREGATTETEGAYRVSNTLRVTVRDIDRTGDVLDTVIEAGANQVYGVNFTVADRQQWEAQAREKAVSDAQARAQELARLAGVEVGEVLSISEVIGGSSVPYAVAERAMGGGGIAPGELEFSTQVQVTFAIQ